MGKGFTAVPLRHITIMGAVAATSSDPITIVLLPADQKTEKVQVYERDSARDSRIFQ